MNFQMFKIKYLFIFLVVVIYNLSTTLSYIAPIQNKNIVKNEISLLKNDPRNKNVNVDSPVYFPNHGNAKKEIENTFLILQKNKKAISSYRKATSINTAAFLPENKDRRRIEKLNKNDNKKMKLRSKQTNKRNLSMFSEFIIPSILSDSNQMKMNSFRDKTIEMSRRRRYFKSVKKYLMSSIRSNSGNFESEIINKDTVIYENAFSVPLIYLFVYIAQFGSIMAVFYMIQNFLLPVYFDLITKVCRLPLLSSLFGKVFTAGNTLEQNIDSTQKLILNTTIGFGFAFLSLRSRVFSLFTASRPSQLKETNLRNTERRVSWMPPTYIFPIVWSIITILRSVSSVMIFNTLGKSLVNLPIAFLMWHLSTGDIWNAINNIDRRRGSSQIFVKLVWLSALLTNITYFSVNKTAGYVFLPTVCWLTIANVIVHQTWVLNGRDPIWPIYTSTKSIDILNEKLRGWKKKIKKVFFFLGIWW